MVPHLILKGLEFLNIFSKYFIFIIKMTNVFVFVFKLSVKHEHTYIFFKIMYEVLDTGTGTNSAASTHTD